MDRYASDFDIPVQDARWRIVDGKIQLAVPESKGRELDLDRGVASVLAAFLDEETEVKLGVRTLTPRWTGKDGSAITLGDDILGEGQTWYGDSSDARRENIEIASSYLNGWLVPPGDNFSYRATTWGRSPRRRGTSPRLGSVDDGNGGLTTAPVIGGGNLPGFHHALPGRLLGRPPILSGTSIPTPAHLRRSTHWSARARRHGQYRT